MINHPIVRLYASAEQAKLALAALKRWGFEDELINVVTATSTPPANAPASAASDDPVQSAIMSAYVLKAHAKVYAQEVRNGRTLISVRAPFGVGGIAEELLDECGPVKSGGRHGRRLAAVVGRRRAVLLGDRRTVAGPGHRAVLGVLGAAHDHEPRRHVLLGHRAAGGLEFRLLPVRLAGDLALRLAAVLDAGAADDPALTR